MDKILIGHNARENDKITSEMSGKDYWFHAADYPGAHVIMKPGGDPNLAAMLAAKNSKAKGPLVKVTIAKGTDVYKPKGSLPGQVTILNSKEITINI